MQTEHRFAPVLELRFRQAEDETARVPVADVEAIKPIEHQHEQNRQHG